MCDGKNKAVMGVATSSLQVISHHKLVVLAQVSAAACHHIWDQSREDGQRQHNSHTSHIQLENDNNYRLEATGIPTPFLAIQVSLLMRQ